MSETGSLEELRRRKEVLLLESNLNRLRFQSELQNLRQTANPFGGITSQGRSLFPLLVLLAPVFGFLTFRSIRRADSWPSRIAYAAKLLVPLLHLWKRFGGTARRDRE